MPNPSYISKASLTANFSQPIDQTNYPEDTSNVYVSKILKVSNSNKDSIAGIVYPKQPNIVVNHRIDSNLDKSDTVSLRERIYEAKNARSKNSNSDEF